MVLARARQQSRAATHCRINNLNLPYHLASELSKQPHPGAYDDDQLTRFMYSRP